ncbi:MAG TPA: RNA polymerase sigma factor [Conexibacter sp.]|nr:RNA polymerase sigma factor [Conexibacter sp.]
MEHVLVDRAAVRLRRPARLLRLASDERLVSLVRAGDESAFEALYDRHHPAILGFCRHMLGTREEAEDAVQHTFLAAFRDLARHEQPIELRPWLFAIARNRCLSLLRARRAHVAIELAEPATDGLTTTVERREDVRELLGDLARLPEDQRAALLLAELGALDHAGIATVLGCPREKVKALVFQARTALAASREARATPCEEIRLELATASGAALRRGPLRRHLRTCAGCRAFKAEVTAQSKLLAIALPVVPTIALKASVLSGGGAGVSASGGGAAAAIGATGSGAATSASSGAFGLLGTAASTGAGKVAVSLALAGAVASGGGALTERLAQRSGSSHTPATLAPGSVGYPSDALRGGRFRPAQIAPAVSAPLERRRAASGDVPGTSGATAPAAQTPASTLPAPGVSAPPATHMPAGHDPAHQTSPAPAGGGSGGRGATPPGQQGTTPPGQQGTTPPGQQGAPPPGHSKTPPGHARTPPGLAEDNSAGVTPPGHGGTPPGQSKAPPFDPPSVGPPGPPADAGSPHGPPGTPPGQSGASHGNGRH